MDARLTRRYEELMLDKMISPPKNIMDEIFSFNVYNLDSIDSRKVGQYIVALSQYMMYFGVQTNKTKVDRMQKKKILDKQVFREDKTGGSRENKDIRRRRIIDSSIELQQIENGLEIDEMEITLVEKLEEYLTELINAFKRELTRREMEIKMLHNERKY